MSLTSLISAKSSFECLPLDTRSSAVPQPVAELALGGGFAENAKNIISDGEVAAAGAGKKDSDKSGAPSNPTSLSASEQASAIKKATSDYTGTDDIDARGIATKLSSGIREATE